MKQGVLIMSGIRYTEEFKRDAVAQVTDRGYSVKDVATRLGISTKSLYDWKAIFHKPDKERQQDILQAQEIRRLKTELARVTEERDILKKATVHSIDHRNIFSRINAGVLKPSVFLGLAFIFSAILFR
ncbi:MAG: hypothetical protein COB46_01620 [Rhodospirillaceae bacterium]|nr:MAG: hypothetical protein COB46_01620 [Rhodospirillaceae bacterium]